MELLKLYNRDFIHLITVLRESSGPYILNGNWALGYTNDYPGAGTVFHYHRATPGKPNPLEYILADGPTNTSVDIMVRMLPIFMGMRNSLQNKIGLRNVLL